MIFANTWVALWEAARATSARPIVSAATSLKCRASNVRGGLPAMRATGFVSTRRETGSKMWVAIGRKGGSLGTFWEVCGEVFFLDENWVLCAWSGSPSCSNQACASKASSLKGEERGVSIEAGPGTTYVFLNLRISFSYFCDSSLGKNYSMRDLSVFYPPCCSAKCSHKSHLRLNLDLPSNNQARYQLS